MNKYAPVVFHTGDGQSAQSTGYAQFYSKIYKGVEYVFEKGADTEDGVQIADPVEVFKPTGYIKFVLHDGIMIVTNDLTAEEAHDMAAEAISTYWNPNDVMYDYAIDMYADWLSYANFMSDSFNAYAGTTPIRNNPHIETVIFGDNVTGIQNFNVFFNCTGIKNVIWVDKGQSSLVYHNPGVELDYVIWNADGEQENTAPGWTADSADGTAFTKTGWGDAPSTGYPATKGTVIVGLNGGTNTAAEQAQAKAYIADMDLPDWALAFLPKEVGGTETARTVDEVFDWNTGNLLPNWNDGSNTGTVTETPVTEPRPPRPLLPRPSLTATGPHRTSWTLSVTAISTARTPASLPSPTCWAADYTTAITRGQFASIAVRLYETRLAMDGIDGTIPVATGDDVFADSHGDTRRWPRPTTSASWAATTVPAPEQASMSAPMI